MIERPDVLVVGAGPAGLAAAVRARAAGCSVLVVDTLPSPGGQIWRQGSGHRLPRLGARWLARFDRSVARFLGSHSITAPGPGGALLAEPVPGTSYPSGEALWIRPRATVLATGARELFLPFPGWTLPGVVGLGGAQALTKSGADLSGLRAIVAGSGPLLLEAAGTLAHAGVRVTHIVEQAPLSRVAAFGVRLWRHPDKLLQATRLRLRTARATYRTGRWVTGARRDRGALRVSVTDGCRSADHNCELLCVGFGLVPETRLAQLFGCEVDREGALAVDSTLATTVPGIFAAGESTRVGGADMALVEGDIAGSSAAAFASAFAGAFAAAFPGGYSEMVGRGAGAFEGGAPTPSDPAPARRRGRYEAFADRLEAAFALRPELRQLPDAETLICRCEDVPFGAVDPAWGAREAKLVTRLGMGPCQGAVCGPTTAYLFGWAPESPRPPIHPTRLSSLITAGANDPPAAPTTPPFTEPATIPPTVPPTVPSAPRVHP